MTRGRWRTTLPADPRGEEAERPERARSEERAAELLQGTEGEVADDPAAAQLAARRILEDSEARVADPAARDPDDDSVIRRSSEETAS